jgi:uncharacterized protein YijF (DUF1287 family)
MKNLIVVILLVLGTSIISQDNGIKLSNAAIERSTHYVTYDGSYVRLAYPGGDVPLDKGVCTDVVIRSYRNALGIDLQKLIHEDMLSNFSKYPQRWRLTKADKNIDHRRTQNQECFFKRHGAEVAITDNPDDYLPGDLVYWGDIASGHVGIVTHKKRNGVPLIVHNIGGGPQLEDFLFASRITGHYRYLPD